MKFVDVLYERNDVAFERGKFRVRGDSIELWPSYEEFAYRIEMWGDEIEQSGKIKGNLDGNKVGDVLATIELTPSDGTPTEHTVIGIEVKFDKSVSLGDPAKMNVETGDSKDKGFKASTQKTAWSQLLETKANRDSPFSIMGFDANLLSADMRNNVEDVAYIPGIPGTIM